MENALVVPSGVRLAASVIERTVANDAAYLESDDSAFCALTDFRRDYPITVEPQRMNFSSLDTSMCSVQVLLTRLLASLLHAVVATCQTRPVGSKVIRTLRRRRVSR